MDVYRGFCQQIDDGVYDDGQGLQRSGLQRLIMATDPHVISGGLTTEEQHHLELRLLERGREQYEERQTG